MIQNILRYLAGIEQYGIISLCLFGTLFVGILTWALLQRKGHMDRMSRVPLETEPVEPSPTPAAHE
jgi:hypothetical protein